MRCSTTAEIGRSSTTAHVGVGTAGQGDGARDQARVRLRIRRAVGGTS